MKEVTIYTDGACAGNPGPGGWGAVLICGKAEKEISGGEKFTTNNRMELTAVISALRCLKEPCKVELYTDSRYIERAINDGWLVKWKAKNWRRGKNDSSAVKNPDLWQQLDELFGMHDVKVHWVKGHALNAYNNRCDALATAQRDLH